MKTVGCEWTSICVLYKSAERFTFELILDQFSMYKETAAAAAAAAEKELLSADHAEAWSRWDLTPHNSMTCALRLLWVR